MLSTDQARIEKLARRRAKAKLGWFAHAAIYALVNFGLIALSLANGRSWAIYPLLGWGVGLLAHGLSVWMLPPGGALLGRMVERERAKLAAGAKGDPW
ncbi:2TM domain-containing protein [Variovorax sp. J22P271]|uniref:2TM domain-containing protein n=1 Tax=Variovorax davisae TaxID=3053515 RepID=UPI002576D55A|nr:2TM domain-containing protein [Variovorax sp. J22P271]MDM0030827.1 2TM domain-containing protein [Variovorax sp. J22P271]